MSKTIRMLLLGLVGAIALSSAGTALAAYTSPSLRVTDDRSAVTIRYTVSATDDPTAKLTFYAPTGYSASLAAAAGTTLGTVTAQGTAADLGGALLPLTGTVQARADERHVHVRTRQSADAARRGRDAVHGHADAHRLLGPDPPGRRQTLELPVFVDSPAVGTGASAFATSSIQACLPPPDVPTGTPGRATFGFKLTQVDFKVNGVFTSAGSGQPRWRVLATPYVARPPAARTRLARSRRSRSIPFPRALSLRKPTLKTAKGIATLTRRRHRAAADRRRRALRLYRGKTAAGLTPSVTLAKSGTQLPRHAAGQADGQAAGRLPAGHGRASRPARTRARRRSGVQCVGATRAAVAVRSGTVRFVIPARKK